MGDWLDDLEKWLGFEPVEKKPAKRCQECDGQEFVRLVCRCGFRLKLCISCFNENRPKTDLVMDELAIHHVGCIWGPRFMVALRKISDPMRRD